jgi:Ca2+-binding EF-hand superfamily protein
LAFNSKKIKKALYSYFASMMATNEDKENFTEMFRAIDKDGDGVLTAEEFEEAMGKTTEGGGIDERTKEISRVIVKKG